MSIEVDPFEVVVIHAQLDGDLSFETGGQIDLWHRYGQDADDWPLNSKAFILTPTPGVEPELDDEVQRVGFEARCYGDSPADCGQVYMKVIKWLRTTERRTIEVTGGKALLYYVLPLSSPRFGLDDDIRPNGGMPFYAIPLRAEVSELFVV